MENRKFSDIKTLHPRSPSFFIDEQPYPEQAKCSINDGYIGIDFLKKGPVWPDLTGSGHNQIQSSRHEAGQEDDVPRGFVVIA